MRLAAWVYYLLDRRIGKPGRFDRLYRLDRDPFGYEIFAYEQEKNAAVLRMLASKQYQDVLDVGCGTGVLTRLIAPFAQHITALDFSAEAIAHAREQATISTHVDFVCADIRTFEPAAAYDLVVCSEVLYYLRPDELEAVVRRLARTLQPGAEIVTVCKLSNKVIPATLKRYAREVGRIDRSDTRRPYSIIKFQF